MSNIYDTILGEYIKNPGKKGLGLDDLAKKLFQYEMISYDSVTNKGKIDFCDIDLETRAKYSGEDVYMTSLLYKKQKEEKVPDNEVLQNIELPLLEVIKEIELNGVKIDKKILEDLGVIFKDEIVKLEKAIFEEAGCEFNVKSPKQVGEILFEKMGLASSKKTKTGFSVDAEVLEELARENNIAKLLLEHRTFQKLQSTYIEGLIPLINQKTGKIHTNYNQIVTSTGRLSSTNPNLQNIPSSVGIAGEIRGAFIPENDDNILIAADYSQVEIRVLALMSGDENLVNAFKNDIDIHYNTAKLIFGKDEINKDERRIAKSVNFGVIYGISPFGLAKMLNISQKDAKSYIEKFFENYPKVKSFFEEVIKKTEETGYTETMFGRKRYIEGINDRNKMIKQSAERESMNMPIQGTAADIIKFAMIKISKFLKENNLKSKMIMQVHDELVFDVPKTEKEFMEKNIKEIMENIISGAIKLTVDIESGKNWKECK
ncbi:MAG: DNA polymerase [Candidatus Gracilibacteria bacterium]|nr:DNA polymerase [Candidatus Gracilibacteria bacterium]